MGLFLVFRPEVSKKFKGLKLLVAVTVNLRIGSFENEINLKIDFKPDFLNLALVLV